MAPAQQPGSKREDLERHDLSVPGREVIQTRVELGFGYRSPRHAHPGDAIIHVVERALEYQLEGTLPVRVKAGDVVFVPAALRLGVLTTNPARLVQAPREAPPRRRYLEHHDVLRLVEAHGEPFRTLSALIHGAGMEVSAALRVTRAVVDPVERTVGARGTKTHARDRVAYVAAWAWPYVKRHAAHLTPAALLFPDVDRFRASKAHREACDALGEGFEDYRLHDARHSHAVRAIRGGAPFEHVAAQLGHANTQMVVKVYGRFKPSADERRGWERVAEVRERELAASRGVA